MNARSPFALALALATACSVDVDLTGKRCPCADGWQCDTTTSRCVPNGIALGTATPSGPVDVVVPDRLRVAQGSSVTMTVTPAQPDMGTFSVAVDAPPDIAIAPAVATLVAPAPVSFDVRPSPSSATGTVTLAVHAFRGADDPGVHKSVALEIVGKPGSADTTFGPNGALVADAPDPNDEAATDDGLFVTTASSDNASGCHLLRIGFDGKRDATYGGGSIAIDADYCRIAQRANVATMVGVTDRGASFPTHASIVLERFAPSGAPDATFNGGAPVKFAMGTDNVSDALALGADGAPIVAARSASGSSALVQFDANGAPRASFGANGRASLGTVVVAELRIASDGTIVVGGRDPYASSAPPQLRRYTPDGKLDAAFGDAGVVTIGASTSLDLSTIAVAPNGHVFAFVADQTRRKPAVYAFDAAGKPDVAFGENGVATPSAGVDSAFFADAAVLDDGSIVAAGGDTDGAVVARFDASGHGDDTFDGHVRFPESAGFYAHRLFVVEGKLLVAGSVAVSRDGGLVRSLGLARYWR